MSRAGPLVVLAAGALVAVAGIPAGAHRPATVRVVHPVDGVVVTGDRLTLELVGEGGPDPATFDVVLDGHRADTSGRVPARSPFTTFRIGPGERTTLELRLPRPGRHELVVTTRGDAHALERRTVRRFTSRAAAGGFPTLPIAVAAGAGIALVGLTAARRRAHRRLTRAGDPAGPAGAGAPPGAGPGAEPAGPAPTPGT